MTLHLVPQSPLLPSAPLVIHFLYVIQPRGALLTWPGIEKKKPNAAPVIRGLWFKSRVQKQTSKEGKSTTAASIAPQKASSNEDMNS